MTERSLAFLRALPDVDPPPALWNRIERAQSRRRSTRRAVSFAMAATVLVAVMAVGTVMVGRGEIDRDVVGAAPPISETITRSHALERDLAAVRSTGQRASLSLEAELARVDADLARAYARQASEAELHTLWSARVTALETLVALHRHPEAIRI